MVIASTRSGVGRTDPTSEVGAEKDEALSVYRTDPQVTDQSQANVRDTVDPTSTETGGPATLRSRGEEEIPRNPDFTDFEEQLREIDTAISETATNPEGSPFPDPSPDFEEDKEGILGISKLNEKENKGGRQKELQVGPSTKVDLVLMDLDSAIPTQNNATLGQASSQAQILFSIGPHNQKPSCEAEIRKVRGPAQKKTKQVTNVMGKENAWKKGRDTNKGDVEVNEMMMKSEDDEMGSKRKSRLPLVDITMEEEAVKKQKMEGEVWTLSKIMATQLGSAVAAGQPRREQ
nr:hypothetical protein CFP56_05945 [Quercus suber]